MDLKAVLINDQAYPEALQLIGREADLERRTGAQMAAILIEEAAANREAKRRTGPAGGNTV